MKTLSDQLNRARILTPDDIHANEVGIGSIVKMVDSAGKPVNYTILGPWDANPEQNILSSSSKFAQSMIGKKVGDNIYLKEEKFEIVGLSSYFNK